MSEKVKVGLGQILVEGGCADANLARAVQMIRRAAAAECRIVVLPECLDTGWTHPSAMDLAQPIPGRTSDALASAAASHRIYTVAGITEREGARIFNAAVLIAPDGEILLKHRKLNELEIAHEVYAAGDCLGVAETPIGTLGVTICADNFPESLVFGHALARMGCQLLLSPCAWAVDADHDNQREPYGELWLRAYSELAQRYGMPVVGVSNVGWLVAGPWRGRKCIGCSLAVGAGGSVLAQGSYGHAAEELIVVDVEMREHARAHYGP